jgi:RimJ/RimL family protein N-acetyltransferase
MLIIDRGEYFHQENSDDILIRTLVEDDVSDSYVRGLNDIAVNLYLVGAKEKKQTLEDVRSFVRMNENDDCGHLFGLFIREKLRGTCRLHDITDSSAYLGIAIFDKNIWGKSFGSSLIMAVTNFALNKLNINRIEALIHEENIASIKSFEKAKFECIKSKSELKDGVRFEYFVYYGSP